MSKRDKAGLTEADRKALESIRANGGHVLLKLGEPAVRLRKLCARGHLVELPGLFDGYAQGYAVKD